METIESSPSFLEKMSRRVVAWGSIVGGSLGLVLAVNAALSDDYTGAGVCLAASALAFAVMAYAFLRR